MNKSALCFLRLWWVGLHPYKTGSGIYLLRSWLSPVNWYYCRSIIYSNRSFDRSCIQNSGAMIPLVYFFIAYPHRVIRSFIKFSSFESFFWLNFGAEFRLKNTWILAYCIFIINIKIDLSLFIIVDYYYHLFFIWANLSFETGIRRGWHELLHPTVQ